MRTRFEQPRPGDIARMLAGILGLRVQASARKDPDPDGLYVGTYVDDGGHLVAVCGADLRFVAGSGAALSMIAPEVAEEMIEAGDVSDPILDNFHEILNICSRLLMKESGGAHLRLERALRPADGGSKFESLTAAGRRLSFDVSLQGYGDSRLSYVIT
ncbi:MAG: hypothetical protein R3315_01625 [Woeseiaceae bacterium]|nr:hypothetical protein [Woeseiaceae bacterium]